MHRPFQASRIGILAALGIGLLAGSVSAADAGKLLKPLWEIGKADGNYAEFALASQGYESFEEDGVFVVGRSDPKIAWPFVHPGPLDTWAGSREHTFTILFGVKKTAESDTVRLVFDLVDTQHADPPQLRVEINGRKFQQQFPRALATCRSAASRRRGSTINSPSSS